jgi:hypothetical protein
MGVACVWVCVCVFVCVYVCVCMGVCRRRRWKYVLVCEYSVNRRNICVYLSIHNYIHIYVYSCISVYLLLTCAIRDRDAASAIMASIPPTSLVLYLISERWKWR